MTQIGRYLSTAALLSLLSPHAALARTVAGPAHSQVAPPPALYPAGARLLRRSLTAMRGTLRTDHGSQISTVHDAAQHESGTIQYAGDCALARASLGVTVRQSARFSSRPPTITSFVVIASMSTSHTWARSAQSHNRWTQVDFAQIGGGILTVCPSLYLRQFSGMAMTNQGSVTIDGHRTWHLQSRQAPPGETNTQDFYLDQATLYPMRLVLDQTRGSFHFHVLTTYSRFNSPITVPAPASPNGPPPPLTGGLSVVVTPNPMPGGATPTVTITTASGARCRARVMYALSATRRGPAIARQLGTQSVGTTGMVRWRFTVPNQAVDGNAMVDCSRGRSTTNQVASFFVFS